MNSTMKLTTHTCFKVGTLLFMPEHLELTWHSPLKIVNSNTTNNNCKQDKKNQIKCNSLFNMKKITLQNVSSTNLMTIKVLTLMDV